MTTIFKERTKKNLSLPKLIALMGEKHTMRWFQNNQHKCVFGDPMLERVVKVIDQYIPPDDFMPWDAENAKKLSILRANSSLTLEVLAEKMINGGLNYSRSYLRSLVINLEHNKMKESRVKKIFVEAIFQILEKK